MFCTISFGDITSIVKIKKRKFILSVAAQNIPHVSICFVHVELAQLDYFSLLQQTQRLISFCPHVAWVKPHPLLATAMR
jgi:hypothetical protein